MAPFNARAASTVDDALAHARQFSRYLDRALTADPLLVQEVDLRAPYKVAPAREAGSGLMSRDDMQRRLRRLRAQTLAALIVRDLAGWADLTEVTHTMTALAEGAIAAALDWVTQDLGQTLGTPRGQTAAALQRLHVVGMGKLGGGELNVSSDIDLVFVYPEEGDTDGARTLSNHEFFSRAGRQLIGLLSEITADGYVFRVDMRLRPYGESGPLVSSFDMLENYLVTQGRDWERYAWIKGRVLTGNQGTELMALVRPFVFRRHLDYSAFASMRELHSQIRSEVSRRDRTDNIKLGRGGIREIEFIAQVFQLIRGGHDAALRRQPTLAVLALLAERGLMPAPAVAELIDAYVFLRNLEHRLQYLDDQQTHALPASTDDQTCIARSTGFGDYAGFLGTLNRHRDTVARHFDVLFAQAPAQQHALAPLWDDHDAAAATEVAARFSNLGFTRAAELQSRVAGLRTSARYRQMPAASQSRLDRLVPLAIESAAAGPNADATLERLLAFLEGVSRRESYLALLEEYPQARAQLTGLMRASPWVAQYLTQYPILLDEMLDTRTLHAPPDWTALANVLREALDDAGGDTERQMDILRHFKHAQTIRLVAQDLAGTLPLETLSDHLSDLACLVLAQILRLAWLGVRQRHHDAPAFAVIGYGKLGGKELGYASDLDLVFLYDDDAPEAAENYARLAQRISTWLTSTTAAGQLYDIDLRLRPDGASGMLVSSLARFRDYQLHRAWVWEHQALTRARFTAGDAAIGDTFETLRRDVLRQPRELPALRAEITAMREKMHAAHPNRGEMFDVKHDRGGIVDVEFIVQYLVLGHAHRHAALTGNIGNLALLKLAATLGLIESKQADAAHTAYREFRRLQHALRLQGETYARAPKDTVAAHAAAVRALWNTVMEAGAN